ncbi:hypothetical protein DRN69_04455 [Candidatus Pacearchaeota archaeon]|nr:MAG: hypothetical protein DRN69_04455 [Candidatus Pacearchaeota archaeon]
MIRRYKIEAEFDKNYEIPQWTGTILRGIFGQCLKHILCRKNKKTCEKCSSQKTCEYQYIFETSPKLFKNPLIARKLEGITKPYTLEPLRLQENRKFIFYLNLIGKRAINLEPFMILVLKCMSQMGLGRDKKLNERRTFQIKKIVAENDLTDQRTPIYNENEGYLNYDNKALKTDIAMRQIEETAEKIVEKRPDTIQLLLETPTMVRYGGKPVLRLEVHHIIRNLARKYSLTMHYHLNKPTLTPETATKIAETAEKNIKNQIIKVRTIYLTKYSLERKQWEKYGPFIKGLTQHQINPKLYENKEIAKWIFKLLTLGKYLHTGTLATAGCGKYTLHIYKTIS